MFAVYAKEANLEDPLASLVVGERPDPVVKEGWVRVKGEGDTCQPQHSRCASATAAGDVRRVSVFVCGVVAILSASFAFALSKYPAAADELGLR